MNVMIKTQLPLSILAKRCQMYPQVLKNVVVDDKEATLKDPKVTAEFYQLVKKLNESGVTIIMVSHDIQAAVEYASHILQIGKHQMYFGTKEKYLESDAWKIFQYDGGGKHE